MKNKKGITLVALIITIIVMLILAGVAISMVMGDNGVVSQTENATEKQKYAVAEEKIRTQSEFITQGENAGKVDLAKTEENIENLGLGEVKETKIEGNTLKVILNDDSVVEIDGVNTQDLELSEEEKIEIQGLLMQYAIALESNDTVKSQESKSALLQKGVNLNEVINILKANNGYIYCHNKKILINNMDLSIEVPTNEEIVILDELYNIAECVDNELDINGFPENSEDIRITYKGQNIIIYNTAGTWNYQIEQFRLDGYNLMNGGRYRGI